MPVFLQYSDAVGFYFVEPMLGFCKTIEFMA